jgi:hypothetical protein
MTTQDGGKSLMKLGKNGKKLRVNTKVDNGNGKGKTEFLCLSCKRNRRISRRNDKLCLDKMPNGAYRLHGEENCSACKRMHKVSLFVSKKLGEELSKDIPEGQPSKGIFGLGFFGL